MAPPDCATPPHSPGSDLDSDDARSEDSIHITEVLSWDVDEDERLCYLCRNGDGGEEYYDRSDLMDEGAHQRLVLRFERQRPPPWDPICPFCDGEGCEECQCPDCDGECRFFHGTNYGCPYHPVV